MQDSPPCWKQGELSDTNRRQTLKFRPSKTALLEVLAGLFYFMSQNGFRMTMSYFSVFIENTAIQEKPAKFAWRVFCV